MAVSECAPGLASSTVTMPSTRPSATPASTPLGLHSERISSTSAGTRAARPSMASLRAGAYVTTAINVLASGSSHAPGR